MPDYTIIKPSKPRVVSEEEFSGIYEIDGLYPGYGHTLGNSLRRIILLSIPGAAITSVKIDGVNHEFSTIDGVKEDVVTILLNLKKIRFKMIVDEPQEVTLSVKGPKKITAADFKAPGQIEVLNLDQYIAELTDKKTTFSATLTVEKGLGYIPKEVLQEGKVDIGVMAVDAIFTPIRRVSYEVENMRVGDRTDYNRLRISIETDGTLLPREALEYSIATMIDQLSAVVGFEKAPEEVVEIAGEGSDASGVEEKGVSVAEAHVEDAAASPADQDFLKTRIEKLDLSTRTLHALDVANIRTVGGLARKKEDDLKDIEGLGPKGIEEIKFVLGKHGVTLR
ncbi:MAG: DNA-directed RNA polymerase subunit alpha [Candidatus Lloydbacteria bacterium CG22_combo_CG10-13_8_21_14_all_47_15]|uniref:DNA-directed RNA polymerase subunit alpha n=1 Tax=Candidatus Lloydbacteria bacterium CG22_combo_CG10-13_8_21_14_all_47_15 TaxID=1974635 RepID=A0A2H0CTT2_9BACT|nr:MAG: DNA-directed RNA polymerase subunit alpha [Candidatus Lloydbacteria bacterium CG22_combo_CG10-13_8_21_14_all_47_15]